MRIIILIIGLLFSCILSAQIGKRELRGNWTTNNTDSLYFKSDSIEFIKSDTRIYCNNMDWSIQKRNKFGYTLCDCCYDPPRITTSIYLQKLKLENNIIQIFVNNRQYDKFLIVDLINFEYNDIMTKKLILKRIQ